MKFRSAAYTNERTPTNIHPSAPIHFLPRHVSMSLAAIKTPGMLAIYCIRITRRIVVYPGFEPLCAKIKPIKA